MWFGFRLEFYPCICTLFFPYQINNFIVPPCSNASCCMGTRSFSLSSEYVRCPPSTHPERSPCWRWSLDSLCIENVIYFSCLSFSFLYGPSSCMKKKAGEREKEKERIYDSRLRVRVQVFFCHPPPVSFFFLFFDLQWEYIFVKLCAFICSTKLLSVFFLFSLSFSLSLTQYPLCSRANHPQLAALVDMIGDSETLYSILLSFIPRLYRKFFSSQLCFLRLDLPLRFFYLGASRIYEKDPAWNLAREVDLWLQNGQLDEEAIKRFKILLRPKLKKGFSSPPFLVMIFQFYFHLVWIERLYVDKSWNYCYCWLYICVLTRYSPVNGYLHDALLTASASFIFRKSLQTTWELHWSTDSSQGNSVGSSWERSWGESQTECDTMCFDHICFILLFLDFFFCVFDNDRLYSVFIFSLSFGICTSKPFLDCAFLPVKEWSCSWISLSTFVLCFTFSCYDSI